uniref:Tetraspanin n=1 Tax=Romanomermis culicivorax TaxID=13658 RepID=A0A915J9T5_ROMCU
MKHDVESTTLKIALFIVNFLLAISGVSLICISLWLQYDPRRNYVLNFVDLSEKDPLLLYADYLTFFTGVACFLLSFVGCFGIVKEMQCLLISYSTTFFFIIAVELFIGILAGVWYASIHDTLDDYLYNMTTFRYGREKWITNLVDTVQFYHKCCGFNGTQNYDMSYWQKTHSRGIVFKVPKSCCKQNRESFPPENFYAIDDWCQYYGYNSSGQLSSVYIQ